MRLLHHIAALFLAGAALAQTGVPRVPWVAPDDTASEELYFEHFTQAEDPTLGPNEYRLRTYGAPRWYPDETTGELQRIEIDAASVTDPADNEAAYEASQNTIAYRLNANGVSTFKRGPFILRTRLLQVRIEDEDSTTLRRAMAAQRPSSLTKESSRVIRASGLRAYLDHETRILNGAIKENLVINSVPDAALADAEAVLFVFQWDASLGADLTLEIVHNQLHWKNAAGKTVFRAKRPIVYDAALDVIPSRYLIRGNYYAIGVRARALRLATYPVTVDPTYTTDAADAVHSSSTKDSTGLEYEGCYQQFRMPGLHGATSITAAVAGFYTEAVDADMTFSVYCDVVAAWTESSAYTTLEALSFNAATATSQLMDTDDSYEEYDILGSAGTNGIANVYNGTDTPNNATVKLFRDLSVSQAYKENFFLLGTYSSNYVAFNDNSEANPPYIEIAYTGLDYYVNDNVADAGFHVLYNRSTGDNDYDGGGEFGYSSAYALLANPPDLTNKTVEEAWVNVYVDQLVDNGVYPVSVYIADTGTSPWTEASEYTTLNGLTMGTASSNAFTLTSTGYKWVDVTDIVTTLFAGDATPETITVKLKQTEFSVTDNDEATVFDLGDVDGVVDDFTGLHEKGEYGYLRLYIWYSDGAPPAAAVNRRHATVGILSP